MEKNLTVQRKIEKQSNPNTLDYFDFQFFFIYKKKMIFLGVCVYYDVFNVEYIIADFKAVFMLNTKIMLIF